MATLDSFPPEIWLACWVLVSRRQLRGLSLVCKLFRSLCLPVLFAHQSAGAPGMKSRIDRIEHTHRLHRLALRLDKLAQPPYVSLVRSWRVTIDPVVHVHFSALRDRAYTKFLESLGSYRNLVSLEMTGILIDERVRTTLRALDNLEELKLNLCDVDPPVGALVQVERFTSSSNSGSRSDLHPQPVQRLDDYQIRLVDPTYLVELHLNAPAEGRWILNGALPNLQHLTLHPGLTHAELGWFLERCPALTSLVFHGLSTGFHDDMTPLSSHLVPHLSKLTAPVGMVVQFATGRPVNDVTLSHPWHTALEQANMHDILGQISQGTSSAIRILALPETKPMVATLVVVRQIFPALSELTLDLAAGVLPRIGVNRPEWSPRRNFVEGGNVRSPELDEETAFEGLPEISEDDEPVTISQTGCEELLQDIIDGLVDLPPNLRALRVRPPRRLHYCPAHEYSILAAADRWKLQERYPSLDIVAFGSSEICRAHSCVQPLIQGP
ncbi:hypothetical protein FB45DRAFT_901961 [Roridomyces roridus]|uniref:F-box domain-containing protein n=1 Tax=Roridomyces roridus TaxID=1738132 RepID=A0AAD7C9C9_9AGAR|nr:hypothetical protein FB45DRAFT_901961 [Roridomyces roridus]